MSYDNLKLEKGMYRQEGMNFTQVLESLDPSENYRGTALEGTDAFQRQLKRFGIRVKGAGSSTVEKFFRTTDSAVLFPEYIARTVRQGMEENDILPAITATTTVIDSLDYRSIYSNPTDEDLALQDVEEGAAIPETEVKTKANLVSLTKRGRMLVASYEALRFQKLDLFGVMLRQIGSYIQKQQLSDAVNVLISGDGNDNAAVQYTVGTDPISGTKGTLGYDQLVEFWGQFDPFTMNTILCSTATMTKLMKIPELQNPMTGLNFQGTGKAGTPLGAQLHRTGAVADGVIVGLDNRYALELVRAGDVLVEYDKLIDRQLERAAISSISKQDKQLLDKMYAERDGIVYKAVTALQNVIGNGYRFSEPESVADARKEYQHTNSTVVSFFKECMCPWPTGRIQPHCTTGRIFKVYRAWCQDNNQGYAKTAKEFREELAAYLNTTFAAMTTRQKGNTYYRDYSLTQEAKEQYQREYGFDGMEFLSAG